MSSRQDDAGLQAGLQDILPPVPALHFRTTRDERANCNPILVAVHFYRFLQVEDFLFCPFTSTSSSHVGIQDTTPSITTLNFRSTRQRGNCNPIYPVLLVQLPIRNNCFSQIRIFFWCPLTSGARNPRMRLRIRQGICICIITFNGRRR
jgi:cell wall-associated NlpC family hydrolase